jgi:outer membrane protein OmpA-like peptidoglycan-associated protein
MVPAVTLSFAGFIYTAPASLAQQVQNPVDIGETPVYRVDVVEYVDRTTKAVNYRHQSGATKIDFEGTPLLTKANGEAKVESKKGYIEIEVEFDDLTPATQFGPEYLTYVMWAITPEGRATNLGEVLLSGNRGKLNVTTELQSFGLLVTAEPYFAVSQPSDVVVLENVIRKDTAGKVEMVDAKFELMKRGTYVKNVKAGSLGARKADAKTPLELIEAENAIQLVRAAGAEQYAKDTFDKAVQQFTLAARYASENNNRKPAIMSAREAVQTAEDARLITLQRQEEARLTEERRIATERTNQANLAATQAAARATAEAEARRIADSNAERAAIERGRAEADRARAEADRVKADADRARADAAAAQAATRADAEAQARRQAEEASQRSALAKAEADTARQAADQARAAAETARMEASREADRLAKEREAAETARAQAVQAQEAAQKDAAELRGRLQQQLNAVLETKQTARGLIVNMSDVLFDVGKSTLKPGAREKLAKVAGIVMAHPDLSLQLEGHTDSTGSDETNQRLSESRASSTREFLVSQGIQAANITSKGFGETSPVAPNDNAAGRQQNRRVELVISGASISQNNNSGAATAVLH